MNTLVLAIVLTGGLIVGVDQDEVQRNIAAIVKIAQEQDTDAACRAVEADRAPLAAVQLYHSTARTLYQQRNVTAMTALSQAGIRLGLAEAKRIDAQNPEMATLLRGEAKALAYDLGANLWPGWQDEGIVLTPADLATGLEAARLNLRLAEELNRPPLPRSNAHWLVGAQELARGESDAARKQFELATEQAIAAEMPDYTAAARGYVAIAALKQHADDPAAQAMFDNAVHELQTLKTDDASFFAEQLVSVRALFAPAGK